jgi:hypothetical protein
MTRPAHVAPGGADEAPEVVARLRAQEVGGRRRDHVGLPAGLRADLGVDAVGDARRERHLQRDDGEHQHVGQRQQQPGAEAYGASSSGAAKRKPTPRTVWMYRGVAGSSPSLRLQPAHVDVERLRRPEPVLVPDAAHQVLAADDAAGVARELGEQVELLAAELDLLPADADPARGQVDVEVVHRDRRRLLGPGGPAQHGADARDHLRGAERLDDVVVGAELEADDAVGLGPAGGDHDHRDVRVAAQPAADVAAVAVGQREVEEDEIGLRAAAFSSASAAVRATVGSNPSRASSFANGSAIEASSSTSRIRGPAAGMARA